LLPQGHTAAILALPWLVITGLLAAVGLERAWRRGLRAPADLCIDASLVYVVIGAVWAIGDRLGARPLNFGAMIVLLTAVHFHYAGFVLPLLTGLAGRQLGGCTVRLTAGAVIISVPMVAAGITATQLNLGTWLECLAAWGMAAAGLLAGAVHLRLATCYAGPLWVRGLWVVAALSLSMGMVCAALYGMRFYLPLPGLTIPWMQAVHGTLNALGFGLSGTVAWTMSRVQRTIKSAGTG
jgi:hypothetical protein